MALQKQINIPSRLSIADLLTQQMSLTLQSTLRENTVESRLSTGHLKQLKFDRWGLFQSGICGVLHSDERHLLLFKHRFILALPLERGLQK